MEQRATIVIVEYLQALVTSCWPTVDFKISVPIMCSEKVSSQALAACQSQVGNLRRGILRCRTYAFIIRRDCATRIHRYFGMTIPKQVVQAGQCSGVGNQHSANHVAYCALEERDCDGLRFFSSRQKSQSEREFGGFCLEREFTEQVPMGRCEGLDLCSNKASCVGTFSQEDRTSNQPQCPMKSARFGRCDHRCVYSPADCSYTETWFPANEECTCDKVKVGACRSASGALRCAVSESACDESTIWVSVRDLDSLECFLCRGETSGPAENNSVGDIANKSGGGGGLTDPEIYGILAFAIGLLMLLSVTSAYIIRKRKEATQRGEKGEENTKPPSEINAMSEEDDVSII